MRVLIGFTILLFIFGYSNGKGNTTRSDFGSDGFNGIVIGDRLYFTDSTEILYTWEEAREYCRSEGSELAKVTTKTLYDNLRLSLSIKSTYWIDGMESKSWFRFDMDFTCTSEQYLELYTMNPENVDIKSNQCLALVKGGSAQTSKIQTVDCISPNRVLCAQPLNGCMMTGD